ncbi:PqqD family protein [Halomonas sp. LY9]
MAPRLRLPLPESISPVFQQFVQAHLGPHDSRYGYLRLNNEQLAAHGQCCPLGAILLIDRDDALSEPQLTRLQPGDGLWQLLQQNFAEHESDQALIQRFLPLLQDLPCFLLRYRDAFEAAQWLTQRWGSEHLESLARASQPHCDTPEVIPALAPTDARRWQASDAAFEFPLGDELFVIAEEGGAIHRLNTTSRAVWALLNHEPMDLESVSDTLAGFFADAEFGQVRQDMAQLLAQLYHAGLIQDVNA